MLATGVFEPPPGVIKKLKMGADNSPRPEADLENFWLKQPVIDMLRAIAELGDGKIRSLEVKNGLPFSMEIEHPVGNSPRPRRG